MDIKFAIVGTAGRLDDGKMLSKKHFDAMYIVAEGLLEQFKENNYPITTLVSGGAAFADHVAVKLFLNKKAPKLKLFLPCAWDNGSFHDNGSNDKFKNPGGIANHYHKKFQITTNINSLSEIESAKFHGAELINGKNFHARNSLVAKVDFILACTFGEGEMVKDGGTADTVSKYLNRVKKEGMFDKSFHYNLKDGNIYVGAKVSIENKTTK